MREQDTARRLLTFTVADTGSHPDARQAAQLARHLHSEHHFVEITFEDFFQAIPITIAAAEMPLLPASSFYSLCKYISQRVKVALIGEGADEIFGGYPEYVDQNRQLSRIKRNIDHLKAHGYQPGTQVLAIYERLAQAPTFDEYLKRLFEINLKDQLIHDHLEFVDKLAMSASLEYRVPYLDDQLVAFVNTLPLHFKANRALGIHKHILKRTAIEHYGPALLDIALRRKLGIPSSSVNYNNKFRQLCFERLPDNYLRRHELGHYFMSKEQLLLFELFLEIFERYRGILPAGFSMEQFLQERA
ncbi:asparagine synthase C-terminal domain-containing protein [Ktedonosporobacter rubrisoli]|nr:asparagine synthase C-terminal domain-containing protein [Ktedonosporobacter rubrisoli]